MSGLTLTWVVFGLVLALFGARAWVVETSRGRFTTGGSTQRGLTAAVAASIVLLVVMATFNGGIELVELLSKGQATTAAPADTGQVNPGAAPPADPNAVPNAPAGQGAPAAPVNP